MAGHACRISEAAAVAICDYIVDLLDAGTGSGNLVIYTGTIPATCDTIITTQSIVAVCVLGDPAYAAASFGTTAADAELAESAYCANATGHVNPVTFYRLVDGDGNSVLQGTCSATAGDDLVLNASIIAATSEVTVTSLLVSVPINQA